MFTFLINNNKTLAIKLFKVVDNENFINYDPFLFFNLNPTLLASLVKNEKLLFSVNYERTGIKSYKSFEKNWRTKLKKICNLSIFDGKSLLFLFGNPNVDLKKPKEKSFVEILINTELVSITRDEISLFVSELLKSQEFDWGYVYNASKSHSIYSETRINWFTSSNKTSLITFDDIIKIKEGYIPKLYEINYLNEHQLKNLKTIYPQLRYSFLSSDTFLVEISNDILYDINKIALANKFKFLIHAV